MKKPKLSDVVLAASTARHALIEEAHAEVGAKVAEAITSFSEHFAAVWPLRLSDPEVTPDRVRWKLASAASELPWAEISSVYPVSTDDSGYPTRTHKIVLSYLRPSDKKGPIIPVIDACIRGFSWAPSRVSDTVVQKARNLSACLRRAHAFRAAMPDYPDVGREVTQLLFEYVKKEHAALVLTAELHVKGIEARIVSLEELQARLPSPLEALASTLEE